MSPSLMIVAVHRPCRRLPPIPSRGFSLVELLMTLATIAVLLGLLLPTLSRARQAGFEAVCTNNLRQLNAAWQGYVSDHQETFPLASVRPDWHFAGVTFVGVEQVPMLDQTRPLNRYLGAGDMPGDPVSRVMMCPGDGGVWRRTSRPGARGFSMLGQAGGETCYRFYGNSYSANPRLLDSRLAGLDGSPRPLRQSDILVDTSRLLIAGDGTWRYAVPALIEGDAGLEASWHAKPDCGHFLAADGSARRANFAAEHGRTFTLSPRP
jgi:prepilin-type N-terminal cleavage/methylation domain-containing protein